MSINNFNFIDSHREGDGLAVTSVDEASNQNIALNQRPEQQNANQVNRTGTERGFEGMILRFNIARDLRRPEHVVDPNFSASPLI
jgi:hypothetical protein